MTRRKSLDALIVPLTQAREEPRVGVLGARSFTGRELIKMLLSHPHAVVTYISSDTPAVHGKKLSEIDQRFQKTYYGDLVFEPYNLTEIKRRCNIVIICK